MCVSDLLAGRWSARKKVSNEVLLTEQVADRLIRQQIVESRLGGGRSRAVLTQPCPGIRNHQFPARVEPIPYSGVSYSCGYSVAIFLLKDDGKRRWAAANPWSLKA